MVQNFWYLNGPPSHMTLPFEYQTPILSSIQVFGIQMDTVLYFLLISFQTLAKSLLPKKTFFYEKPEIFDPRNPFPMKQIKVALEVNNNSTQK